MNDEQKKQQKLEKWGRQIGYTAFKLINLSRRDMAQIRGNGLVITIKKLEDVVNERKYIEETPEEKANEEMLDGLACKRRLEKEWFKGGEETLSDTEFEKQVAKVREGWKK